MTKYRLKDQELQKHLDAISGGEFTATIESGSFEFDEDDMAVVTFGSAMHGTEIIAGKFSVILDKNETYELAKYNPNNWNNYPDVTPPEGVLMRIETKGGRKFCGYYHTFAEGGCWCYQDGTVCPEATSKSVKRFRPWE
jgi:hypothetical protein